MNERIHELFEQALEEFKAENKYATIIVPNPLKEKFAELIVRECLDIALERKKWVEDQEVYDYRDVSWNKARIQQSQHIVDKIREHFGVEE
jgi:hypothetical protein